MTNDEVKKLDDMIWNNGLINVLEILQERVAFVNKEAAKQVERAISDLENTKQQLIGLNK